MRPINRDILKLALPSILANITVPIVGMVDVAVAGHLDTAAATMIGGIAIGSMLFDLLYWNFGFLRVGTGGLAAQAYGRGDRAECAKVLTRSLGIAFSCALLLIAIQWLFVKAAFVFVDCTPEVQALASQYFFIRIWAAPATLALMALKGWFIGMQDSVSAMLTDLTVNGMNVLMSVVLALGFSVGGWHYDGMGFAGVAAGTVAAQYSGLLVALVLLLVKYRRSTLATVGRRDLCEVFKGDQMRRFMSMNADLFVRSLCFIAIYIGFTVISARYGDTLLAVSSILMKLLMIFSYFTDGFAYAGEALVGRYVGAGDRQMYRQTVKWTFIWSMSIALIFMGIYHFAGVPMLQLMTSDVAVVDASREFLPWLLLMPVVGCAAFTWDGIYVGATASRPMRNSMLWAVLAFAAVWAAGILLLDYAPAFFSSDLLAASPAPDPALSPDLCIGLGPGQCSDLCPDLCSDLCSYLCPDLYSGQCSALCPDLYSGQCSAPDASLYNRLAMHILMAAYFAHLLARTIYLTVRYPLISRV